MMIKVIAVAAVATVAEAAAPANAAGLRRHRLHHYPAPRHGGPCEAQGPPPHSLAAAAESGSHY